ncbi:MAG: TlpA family protein disulfide reductase [bacterium]|nr:TlpA family protein disulfide reductase [bacterium]
MRVSYSVLVAVGLLALLGGGCGGVAAPLRVGQQAPEFSLPTLDGGELSSSSLLGGEPIILNFWATWCQPCLKEIPELKEMAANPEVRVVGIALDEEGVRAVKPFVEHHGLDYTMVLGNQEVFQRFSGFSIPFTLVLDPSWKIVNIHRGPASCEELEADLALIANRPAVEGA